MEPSVGDHHAQSAFGARKQGMDPTHLSHCAQKKLLSHSGWESHLSAPSRQGWGSYLQGCTDSSGLQGLQGLQGLSSVGLWLLRDRSKVSAGIFSRSRRAFIPPPPPLRSAPLSPSHRQPPRWAAPTGGRQRRHRRERSSARRARTRPCRSVRLGIARRGSARLSTVRHCSARPARFGAAPSGSARLSSARHGSPSSSPHSPDGAEAARDHRAPGMRRGAEQRRSRTAQNSSGTAQ